MNKYIVKICIVIIVFGTAIYLINEIPSILESARDAANNNNLMNAKNLDYFENFSRGVKEEYYGK